VHLKKQGGNVMKTEKTSNKKGKKTKQSTKSKQVVKNTKSKKEIEVEEKEKKSSSLLYLKIIFFFLIFCVILLGILIYKKEQQKKENPPANIIVPIIKATYQFEFGIDTLALSKEPEQEYVFKVTNYREKDLLKKALPYRITVINPTNVTISLTKEEDTKDLMQEQKLTIIEEGNLSTTTKENIYYHVKITSATEAKSDEFIYIKIESPED